MRCAVLAYRNQAVGETGALSAPQALDTLANCLSDGGGHALASQPRQLLRQSMRLFVFDVQAHDIPFYRSMVLSLPSFQIRLQFL
jgi:hypothetical protein